jgi:uncharacterized protein (TIGR02996 family)
MDQEQAFLQAMLEDPRDLALRLIFADWLEEQGDPRGELLRLSHLLTQTIEHPNRPQMEARLRSLLEAGVQPIGPFWTNSVGMQFAWVPPGVFLMGSPSTEVDRHEDEPQHRVRLTKGVWFGVYPVTQAQWHTMLGTGPSVFEGENLPVDQVSFLDCQDFCAALSRWDGKPYSLPTEAEWEYACRAGTTTPFHFGEVLDGTQANCDGHRPYGTGHEGPFLNRTTPVGSYLPNAWGLWDMHGNVLEWCQDFHKRPAPPVDADDPVNRQGSDSDFHVVRGGSWFSDARWCRSAFRNWGSRGDRSKYRGCRVCFRLD